MSDRMSGQSLQARRIARLLGVESTDLEYLREVPEAELRVLHDQVARAVFAGGEQRMAKVAGLSRSIPAPLAGRLAERFLPPLVAARVAELLEPERARDLVGRVSVPYLADLAVALDPVRARPVVRAIPPERIGQVAGELFARGEHALMAEFVTSVERPALKPPWRWPAPGTCSPCCRCWSGPTTSSTSSSTCRARGCARSPTP